MLSKAQNSFRAKPCCGSLEWSGCSGGPKHGKTTGIPPRIAFEPSRIAFEDTNTRSISSPPLFAVAFQDITVAPNKQISAVAPWEQFSEMSQQRKTGIQTLSQPLDESVGLCHGSFGKASGLLQIRNIAALDKFRFGRLDKAPPRRRWACRARSIRALAACLCSPHSFQCFPQCSSPRRSHFLLSFPFLLQPHQGAEQQFATGSPMYVPIGDTHNRELIFEFTVLREKLRQYHLCWCA